MDEVRGTYTQTSILSRIFLAGESERTLKAEDLITTAAIAAHLSNAAKRPTQNSRSTSNSEGTSLFDVAWLDVMRLFVVTFEEALN